MNRIFILYFPQRAKHRGDEQRPTGVGTSQLDPPLYETFASFIDTEMIKCQVDRSSIWMHNLKTDVTTVSILPGVLTFLVLYYTQGVTHIGDKQGSGTGRFDRPQNATGT